MTFDVAVPNGRTVKLGSLALQEAGNVNIGGGRINQLREFQAHKGDITDFKAKTVSLETLSVSGAVSIAGALTVAGAVVLASLTVSGATALNGSVALGDAAADTLAIAPSAVTWSGNPTHSGTHAFSGNVGIGGAAGAGVNRLEVRSSVAKATGGLTVFADFFTSDAVNPFGLVIGHTGAAAIANRIIDLQTQDQGVSNGGILRLQNFAGDLSIGTSGAALTIVNSAVTWSNNPNHSGNHGFGTTPSFKVHILTNSSNGVIVEQLSIDGSTQNITSSGSGQIASFKAGASYYGAVGGYGNGTVGGVGIWGGTNTGTPHLFVNPSGEVLIGTVTDQGAFKLQVSGNVWSNGYLQNGAGATDFSKQNAALAANADLDCTTAASGILVVRNNTDTGVSFLSVDLGGTVTEISDPAAITTVGADPGAGTNTLWVTVTGGTTIRVRNRYGVAKNVTVAYYLLGGTPA